MECKLLWGQDGGARIRIDDKTLSPVAYMTYAPEAERFASFRADGLKLYSIGIYAGDQGVNRHSGLRPFRSGFFCGPGRYDFDEVAQDLARIAPPARRPISCPGSIWIVPNGGRRSIRRSCAGIIAETPCGSPSPLKNGGRIWAGPWRR